MVGTRSPTSSSISACTLASSSGCWLSAKTDQVSTAAVVSWPAMSNIDQETKKRRVLHVGVVLGLERLEVFCVARSETALDELIQLAVEDVHVAIEVAQPRHYLVGARHLPVRERHKRAVLNLTQGAHGGFDDRRLLANRVKVVVEDCLADDVQRERAKALLHVNARTRARVGAQLRDELVVGLPKLRDHPLKVELVKGRGDGTPPLGPRLGIGGDESLAHDEVARDDRVGDDHEGLGSEAHLEDGAILVEVRLHPEEERLEVDVGDVCGRERRSVLGRVAAKQLLDVVLEGLSGVTKREGRAGCTALHEWQLPHRVPVPGQLRGPLELLLVLLACESP
eukprot:scaffold181686_cov32-Tisochrysis_lutea.AAC.1